MGLFILIAMIGVPIAEIAVFIDVGERIGLGPTLVVVVLTAIIGTTLLRMQGFAVLIKAQASLQENRFPLNELFDGLCLVFAGALLLTPGFVTDSVGFLLFVPPFRALLRMWATRVFTARGQIHTDGAGGPFGASPQGNEPRRDEFGSIIIDGEFSDVTDDHAKGGSDDDVLPPPKQPPGKT